MFELLDEAQAEVHKSEVQFKKFESEQEARDFSDDSRIWSECIETAGVWYRGYSRAGELGVQSIREAGKALGLNVGLDAEYCIGRSWAETH